MTKSKKASTPSYADASEELETILSEIESGTADVDVLSDKVERAAELIKLCRDKINGTEMKVRKVIEELEAEPEEAESADGDDPF